MDVKFLEFEPMVEMKNIYMKISKNAKVAFFSTFIIGFLVHGYAFANNLLTLDTMWNIYSSQDMLSSGRPFLTYACAISSYFDLPWLDGVLGLLFLSIAVALIIKLFDIKSEVCIILSSAIIVTFPSVATGFCYSFTIDGYMIALILSIIPLILVDKRKSGVIVGGLLLGISMGIYQGYLAVCAVLCLMKLMLMVLDNKSIRNVFERMLKYLVMGAIGYVVYLGSLKLMLAIKHVSLSGYQGTNKTFNILTIPAGVKAAFVDFKNFILYGNVFGVNDFSKWATVIIVLITFIVVLKHLLGMTGRVLKFVYCFIFLLLLPCATNIMFFVSTDTFYHLLMRFSWCLFFVFFLVLMERYCLFSTEFLKKPKVIMQWGILISYLILTITFASLANIDYFNMNEKYQKTYAVSIRLVDRLEQTEGYTTGDKVAILGGTPNSRYYPSENITDEVLDGHYASEGNYCVNSSAKFAEFFKQYLNFTIITIDYEDELKILDLDEYKKMDTYPGENSIKKIGDVFVIKLS